MQIAHRERQVNVNIRFSLEEKEGTMSSNNKIESAVRSAFSFSLLLVILLFSIPLTGPVLAQVIPPPPPSAVYDLDFLDTYKDSYPFSASKALVVDESIQDYPICFMGSGGGVYVLNIDDDEPFLFDLATGLGNKLKTDGFVWDLAKRYEPATQPGLIRVFCAAGIDGVYAWTLTTSPPYTTAEATHIYLPDSTPPRPSTISNPAGILIS